MKLNKEIALAIGKASGRYGSNADLGKACGIHGATIGQYRNGMIQSVGDDAWDRLYPHIRDFLPPGVTSGQSSPPAITSDLPVRAVRLARMFATLTTEAQDRIESAIMDEVASSRPLSAAG